jgi:hypothetical protein
MIPNSSGDIARIDDEVESCLPQPILEYDVNKLSMTVQEGKHVLQFSDLKAFGE